ncbi:MAG: hypothetical protein L0Z48_11990 [candidate division Zixibacteria bacterium]|nr:hypothetical protein [candidate division Zixibacteria bacterium]MCI0597245.1 hypothetical protein [candidate division Zixibacteria bacterium]
MPKAHRTAVKVILIYLAVFALWLLAAREYHLLLGKMAATLIPVVENCSVDRVWYDRGVRYEISFYNPHSRQILTAKGVVDAMQYGYPMVTFLVLALAFPGPKEWKMKKRGLLTILGAGVLFFLYSVFIVVAVYEFLGQYEAASLKENWIARALPPALFTRYEIPLLVFLGQVIPVFLWGMLFGWPQFAAKKGALRA